MVERGYPAKHEVTETHPRVGFCKRTVTRNSCGGLEVRLGMNKIHAKAGLVTSAAQAEILRSLESGGVREPRCSRSRINAESAGDGNNWELRITRLAVNVLDPEVTQGKIVPGRFGVCRSQYRSAEGTDGTGAN